MASGDDVERRLPPPAGRDGWPWTREHAGGRRSADGPWPRISVVVPSYAQGAYLEAALRSVLLQGYPALELIAVDGGSRDESVAILERYAPYLTYWTSEPDRGQAHAINKGLARASGDVLGWLNSDDLLLPDSLWTIGEAFRRPEVDVVCGLRREVDAAGVVGHAWVRDRPHPHRLRAYCCVAQETVYWRRSVWQTIGGLDEEKAFALDYEYWLRMLDHGYRFTWLPRFLAACRDHPATKRATRDDDRARDLATIYRRYGLGTSEEAALMSQGPEWSFRLGLFETLCAHGWLDDARRADRLLDLLDHPRWSRRLVATFMRYRLRRRDGANGPRAWVALRAAIDTVSNRPTPTRCEPFLLPSGPLQAPRWMDTAANGDTRATPFDTLAVGDGWSWLEWSRDHAYRWSEGEAELVVLRPSGARRRLGLVLAPGPGLGWQPFPIALVDQDGQELERWQVVAGERREIALDGARVSTEAPVRRLRLQPLVPVAPDLAEDGRLLAFRATWIGWLDATPLHDLVLADGRTLPISVRQPDIVPPPTPRLRRGDRRRRAPRHGLMLGAGWSPLVSVEGRGDRHRRVDDGGVLVVAAAPGAAVTVGLEVAPADDPAPVRLAVVDAAGQALGSPSTITGPTTVRVDLPISDLSVRSLTIRLDPPRPRAVRVRRAWLGAPTD